MRQILDRKAAEIERDGRILFIIVPVERLRPHRHHQLLAVFLQRDPVQNLAVAAFRSRRRPLAGGQHHIDAIADPDIVKAENRKFAFRRLPCRGQQQRDGDQNNGQQSHNGRASPDSIQPSQRGVFGA